MHALGLSEWKFGWQGAPAVSAQAGEVDDDDDVVFCMLSLGCKEPCRMIAVR